MPNRPKPKSDRRCKGLMLALKEKEFDYITNVSRSLGMSKVDFVLSAINKQYNKKSVQNDVMNNYIALLKEQIDECKERIERDKEQLTRLMIEYNEAIEKRTGDNHEDNENIQSQGRDITDAQETE